MAVSEADVRSRPRHNAPITHMDRKRARLFCSAGRPVPQKCRCGATVWIGWDRERQEYRTLERHPRGGFHLATSLPGDINAFAGQVTFFGWTGDYRRHECPGPKPRPELSEETLRRWAIGFPGESDQDRRSRRADFQTVGSLPVADVALAMSGPQALARLRDVLAHSSGTELAVMFGHPNPRQRCLDAIASLSDRLAEAGIPEAGR